MMEGGSLEPVLIKVPKEDVDLVSPWEEVDEIVTESVSDSSENIVEASDSVSCMGTELCNDGEYVESVDDEGVCCRALPMA